MSAGRGRTVAWQISDCWVGKRSCGNARRMVWQSFCGPCQSQWYTHRCSCQVRWPRHVLLLRPCIWMRPQRSCHTCYRSSPRPKPDYRRWVPQAASNGRVSGAVLSLLGAAIKRRIILHRRSKGCGWQLLVRQRIPTHTLTPLSRCHPNTILIPNMHSSCQSFYLRAYPLSSECHVAANSSMTQLCTQS